ncbi:light-harvesting antenna LH1, beta subunit [Halorhodospira neutriphila]|uniref:Light-harvesting protein n=1 Tax=Halorhodospira neutriphila TaxID=168379 RepID=A0ABS1E8J9_9GAMM|nr:light-harvesting antenna LH1, beta subunit [Halorhodospira neutriphila]MBK1726746.1 light-harvesting protein [Halorhodospira neutriphila]
MAQEKPMTNITDEEAKEFHSMFTQAFVVYVGVAVVAHILAWAWRPWIPGDEGYGAALIDGANSVAAVVQQIAPFAA